MDIHRLPFISLAVLINLMSMSFGAHSEPVWTHTASSCAIDSEDLDSYAFIGPNVTYSNDNLTEDKNLGGNIFYYPIPNPVSARCNITNPYDNSTGLANPSWDLLWLGYQDPDGEGERYRVLARLYGVDALTGETSVITTFDSNLQSSYTDDDDNLEMDPTVRRMGLSHEWDFNNNYYYVTLDLYRYDALYNPKIWGVRLTD